MTFRRMLLAACALALTACASTTIRDSWVDPAYRGGPLRKILVLGVSPNLSDRRIFEDIVAARLTTIGADAIPSYRFLPEAGRAAEPALDAAVRASGADGLLMSRVLHIDRRTNVYTTMRSGPPFG